MPPPTPPREPGRPDGAPPPERRAHDRVEPPNVAAVVERNITALLERRRADDARRGSQVRAADAITRFTGSLTFVYIHLVLFGAWIVVNVGWIPAIPAFDRSFTVLAMAASVEAIFLSTFVLISQNRMQAQADKRADLDLQISLLAEHEVTQLITLVREMARRMGVAQAQDPALDELARDIRPEVVLTRMEDSEERAAGRDD
ncbi:DUF1003 domain-containing protein [Roseisolibacter agri]|uniref:DUF1003 domain-containing protein n=1 Tax=Roseisolibacter agri TaxID=2014610 RepID=UPI0024E11862|nr:DUF1003 domain-containing protein [Roseisolibacter agri]